MKDLENTAIIDQVKPRALEIEIEEPVQSKDDSREKRLMLVVCFMIILFCYFLKTVSGSLLPLFMTKHYPQFSMKMQGIVISGWQVTFGLFSPVAVCLQTKFGRKNMLIVAIVLEISSALILGASSFLINPWAYWVMALIGNLICGMADCLIIIIITAIIFTEYSDKANLYYAYVQLFWAAGYTLGPIIPFLAYDSVGNAGVFFLTAGLIVLGALIPAIWFLPVSLNQTEPKDTPLLATEQEVTYIDFFRSYRSMTILVIVLFAYTPVLCSVGLVANKLASMGMEKNLTVLAFTLQNLFYAISSFACAGLSQKVDRRLIFIGILFFCGVINFILGPSPWINFPATTYTIFIGYSLTGLIIGGICQLSVPEIMAGLNSNTFSLKQKKQLSEKAASLGTLVMGASYTIAPIVAGALYDSGGWVFTTDTSAFMALILAATYGIIVLFGYFNVPDYKS